MVSTVVLIIDFALHTYWDATIQHVYCKSTNILCMKIGFTRYRDSLLLPKTADTGYYFTSFIFHISVHRGTPLATFFEYFNFKWTRPGYTNGRPSIKDALEIVGLAFSLTLCSLLFKRCAKNYTLPPVPWQAVTRNPYVFLWNFES